MIKIIGGSSLDKTIQMLKLSAETDRCLLVKDMNTAVDIDRMAKRLGMNIPFPVTVTEFKCGITHPGNVIRKRGILVLDAEDVLQEFIGKDIEIHGMSMLANLIERNPVEDTGTKAEE